MTTTSTGGSSGARCQAADRTTADRARLRGGAATAGSSSAPSPGCTIAADSCSAPTRRDDIDEGFLAVACCFICTKASLPSPAVSSAGDDLSPHSIRTCCCPVHGREVRLLVRAVAERLCVRVAAAAESDRVADLILVALGVEEGDAALDEVGAVVGRCDCEVVHGSSCVRCAPARRASGRAPVELTG